MLRPGEEEKEMAIEEMTREEMARQDKTRQDKRTDGMGREYMI